MGRYSQGLPGTERRPRRRGWEIILSKVNAVGIDGQRQVQAVIHDKVCPALSAEARDLLRLRKELAQSSRFVSKLDQRGPTLKRLSGYANVAQAPSQLRIGDDTQAARLSRNHDLASYEHRLQEPGGDPPGIELLGGKDALVERNGGLHSLDVQFIERPNHPGDGLLPGVAQDDHLGYQGVIEGRDRTTRIQMSVNPHARPSRQPEVEDLAGRGDEGFRIFCIDAALDAMAPKKDIVLAQRQRLAGGDTDLSLDQVDPGDHLRHR